MSRAGGVESSIIDCKARKVKCADRWVRHPHFDAPCESGRHRAQKRLKPWPGSKVFAQCPVLQNVSERPRSFCLRKASGSDRWGRRRQRRSRQPSGSKMVRQGTRGAACLCSGIRLHSACGSRHKSAGAAQRRSLAYQLCRVDVSCFRLAALVSAGAVTSYVSHSTDLSPFPSLASHSLAYICWYLWLQVHIFTRAYRANTHKHIFMISAQKEWQQPGTGAWLEEAEVGFVRDKGLAHTHSSKRKMPEGQKQHQSNENRDPGLGAAVPLCLGTHVDSQDEQSQLYRLKIQSMGFCCQIPFL